MYRLFFKRFFDIFISFFLIIFFSPVVVIILLLIIFYGKEKVLFIQQRVGLNQKVFKLIKLKTMNDLKDSLGNFLPDSMRLTKIGKILRSTSFDELPQLFNVLKGDMSFVGPRPLLVEYLPLYNEFQKRRHEVKPGITGWAQVNGRNALSWEKKFEYDVWYVDNVSLRIDLKILFLTLKKVIKSEGINSKTSVTMEKFKGN